jgi:phosphate transport system substrate-binding protein
MLRSIVAAVLSLSTALASAETVRIGGTGSALGAMRLEGEAFHARTQTQVAVLQALGSGGAVKALLAGGIEVGVLSRALTAEEQKLGLTAFEYAVTPFVFATWPGNAAEGVTTRDLTEFYAGRQAVWPSGVRVRLILRPAGDIDTTLVSALSKSLQEAVSAAGRRQGMLVADTDTEAANLIERTEGSLGPTTLALLLSEKRKVKVLKLDGVAPSVKTLAAGSYLPQKHFHLATGPHASPGTREFAAFVRSPAGRAILERTGHLPVAAR